MSFQTKLMELHQFVTRWSEEVLQEFNIHDAANLVPLFQNDSTLAKNRLPEGQSVKSGHYVSYDNRIQLEVHSQDPKTGLIVLEMVDAPSPSERFQTMSPGVFNKLFRVVDQETITKSHLLEYYQTQNNMTEQEKQTHLNAREDSFSWTSIEEATDEAAQKWRGLNQSLARRDWPELQADYLELLYMVFVLGNRLGYAARDGFAALLGGVFALTDATEEAAALTKKHYEMRGVEIEQRLLQLYDPDFDLAPPLNCWITIATRSHNVNGLQYVKGSLLPSSTSTHVFPTFPYLT